MDTPTYTSLEEIALRKQAIRTDIDAAGEQIGLRWHDLTAPNQDTSKGEMVASLVGNAITAIDGFLLVRKLMKNYGFLFRRKKKK